MQFHTWNEDADIRVVGTGWLGIEQGSLRLLSIYFEGASQEDMEAAAAALRKCLPKPGGDPPKAPDDEPIF